MKFFAPLMCFLLFSASSFAQFQSDKTHKYKLNNWSIAFTNAHSQMPFGSFSRLFYTEWHPGVEIGTGFTWKTKPHHDWVQTFRLGYFYHAFIQHSISLYTETGYAYKFPHTITAIAKLGAGYMQAVPDSEVFILENDKGYIRKNNFGRAQGIFNIDLTLQKRFTKAGGKIFLEYQQRFQIPFIPSYVPVLPYNILMIGCSFPLHK